jgi:hypothetical protein
MFVTPARQTNFILIISVYLYLEQTHEYYTQYRSNIYTESDKIASCSHKPVYRTICFLRRILCNLPDIYTKNVPDFFPT